MFTDVCACGCRVLQAGVQTSTGFIFKAQRITDIPSPGTSFWAITFPFLLGHEYKGFRHLLQ